MIHDSHRDGFEYQGLCCYESQFNNKEIEKDSKIYCDWEGFVWSDKEFTKVVGNRSKWREEQNLKVEAQERLKEPPLIYFEESDLRTGS